MMIDIIAKDNELLGSSHLVREANELFFLTSFDSEVRSASFEKRKQGRKFSLESTNTLC
jgi:hypothetical protein